jgi:hypothetical protein
MEVLVATAIAALTITAGFRLVAMSIRLLNEARSERLLTEAAERILLDFKNNDDMPDSGTEDGERPYRWEASDMSIPVEEFELKLRRVRVNEVEGGHSMYIYIAE